MVMDNGVKVASVAEDIDGMCIAEYDYDLRSYDADNESPYRRG
jgi:hypothetical protein